MMRITLNLASVPSRRERYGLAWAVPLAVLGAVGLVFLARFAVGNVREYRSVQQDIAHQQELGRQLARQEEELKSIVNQPQNQAVSREAQYLNSLIGAKKISIAALALEVSKLMPDSVHLTAFSLTQAPEPTVRFSVVGRDEQALENFLTVLEDSPKFQDVAVSSEGIQNESDSQAPMTITCTARYVGGIVP